MKTWVSTEDIEKGSNWPGAINEALSTTVGVLCVTQENKNAAWLLFEAGGLSKGLTEARVCPLLIDLEPTDLQPPLSLFNLTLPNREDIAKLVRTINAADKAAALDQAPLQKSFDHWWPEFENGFKQIREKSKTIKRPPERSEKEMIVEILEISRALQRASKLAEFEKTLPRLPYRPPGTAGKAYVPGTFEWFTAPEIKSPAEMYSDLLKQSDEMYGRAPKQAKDKEDSGPTSS